MNIPITDKTTQQGAIALPALDDLAVFTPDRQVLERNFIVGFDGRDNRSRPFKLMRTQFTKIVGRENARMIGVTSAAPEAGKSFLALNLAASLSLVNNQAVYLVDLDLRRASIAEQLGMHVECGISDFLNGEVTDLAMLGQRIDGTRLGVFPTSQVGSHTAELLSSDGFDRLVDAFRNNQDEAIVVFDLPPVFANDDTMIVMEKLDGYLMVVDSGKSTRRQVKETMALLQPSPCLGAVLNRFSGGLLESYGYGYGYGYGYQAYDKYGA